MSRNKSAKNELIKKYGAECFIEKLHLRHDSTPRRYKNKNKRNRMKKLTFHHIKMKKDGGEATVENGALLSAENHEWFHQQPQNDQDQMNRIFQEYKQLIDECTVTFVEDLELDFVIKPVTFSIDERGKLKYDRAKDKRRIKKIIEEDLDLDEK